MSKPRDTFDLVAQLLITAGVDDKALDEACFALADGLMDRGWVTDDESIHRFRGHPVVQHAIYRARRSIKLFDRHGGPAGWLRYDQETERWELSDRRDREMAGAPVNPESFNQLIRLWAAELGGTDEDRTAAEDQYLLG